MQFLSGPCLAEHKGKLFACWTNGPKDEDPDNECLRGRWSSDGGKTWGPVQTIAGDATPKSTYGHGTIWSHDGKLWVFAAHFIQPKGSAMDINVEAFLYDEQGEKWVSRGAVAERFWPLETPKPRPGGGWILGGDHGVYPGEGPAVAIIDAKDPLKWQVVDIPFKYAAKPDDGKPPYAIETTLWTSDSEVVAIMRNPYKDLALSSVSRDGGATWSPVAESNFKLAESKAYAGTLSTNQRYVACNSGNREFLILAVGKPGAATASAAFMIRKGRVPARWPTHSKNPQWSYPWVLEDDGKLYIIYAAAKEDCEMTIVPVASLAVK
jgi:hypothetical protein